jgi:hypothetical protein
MGHHNAGSLRSRVTPGHSVDEVCGASVGAAGGAGDVGSTKLAGVKVSSGLSGGGAAGA